MGDPAGERSWPSIIWRSWESFIWPGADAPGVLLEPYSRFEMSTSSGSACADAAVGLDSASVNPALAFRQI